MAKELSEEAAAHHHHGKDYEDPPPAPLLDLGDLKLWSFYRALIAEFIATLLFRHRPQEALRRRPLRRRRHRLGLRRHDLHPRLLHRRHLRWPHQPCGDVRAFPGPEGVAYSGRGLHCGSELGRHLRRGFGEGFHEKLLQQARRRS